MPTSAARAARWAAMAPAGVCWCLAPVLDLGDARFGAAVGVDLDRKRLLLDPVFVLEEVALGGRERDPDPIGQLEPLLAAHRVDPVDQVEDQSLELELEVEPRIECDREPIATRDGPAFPARPLDEHFVGPELVAEHPEAAALELLELTGAKCGLNRAELLPQLRPEHRQVGLHA